MPVNTGVPLITSGSPETIDDSEVAKRTGEDAGGVSSTASRSGRVFDLSVAETVIWPLFCDQPRETIYDVDIH